MKKKFLSLLMALLIFMSLSVTAFADSGFQGQYVKDFNGLLTQEQAESLEAAAKECSETSGCGVYLVIVDDYALFTGEDYDHHAAVMIYEGNDFGVGDDKSGIMLMMSMNDRHMYLLCHGSGSEALPESKNDKLRKDLKGYFKDDEWYEGFCHYMEKATGCAYINAAGNLDGKIDNPFYRSYKVKSTLLGVGLCLIFGLVIAVVVTLILKHQLHSVAQKVEAGKYVSPEGLQLSARHDRFTGTTTRRVYDPPSKNDSSSSSSSSSGGYSGGGDNF